MESIWIKGNKIMKHTLEEVMNAVTVIQDTCKLAKEPFYCESCPLSKNGYCVLEEQTPDDWKIKLNLSQGKVFG